jgi:hypothetical protein
MKITFFSFTVNNNFPIDIMYRQFKKYMKEDFDFILFNDAFNTKDEVDINTVASCNNINCVRVPQSIHPNQNPSGGYAETLNWALHEYTKDKDFDIIVLMHSDIFPICQTSISEILGNYVVASTTEFRKIGDVGVTYLYPAFTIINMKALKQIGIKELDFGLAPGVDTGGKTKDFVAKYPDSVKLLPNHQASYFLRTLNENESLAQYFKEDLEITRAAGLSSGWICEGIYHYMAGTQWNLGDKPEFFVGHQKRMQLFLKYFY